MRQPSSPAVLALALLFLADPRTAGAALLDPTRPLAGGGREEAATPKPAEMLAAAVAAPLNAASAPEGPPALQSLQVPQQGEATAIVDGQLLKVGGKLGSYEVTHIDAHGLMVRGPAGRERWTLAGVEVLDSRQSAASLKMGPMGDVRKASRRPTVDASLPLQDLAPRVPGAAAPSPLVFPLPVPQGQPLPRLTPPLEQPPQTAPVPPSPARPAIKQALAAAAPLATVATPMTVAYQPAMQPVQRAPLPVKRGTGATKTWTASTPSKALRMDLDDMRRIVQMVPAPAKVAAAFSAPSRWQRPVGPNPYGVWVAAWAAGPAITQRQTLAQATTGLVLARWQPPQPLPRALPATHTIARYSPPQGPRPMPASVVWRQTTGPKAWQPQGVNDLPGAHTSQWASAPAPLLRIAAMEAKAATPRSFARASFKPAPRTWAGAGTRWAQARSVPTVQAQGPVTHTYPMALPQWRSAPTAQADNSSLTQVAYALETP